MKWIKMANCDWGESAYENENSKNITRVVLNSKPLIWYWVRYFYFSLSLILPIVLRFPFLLYYILRLIVSVVLLSKLDLHLSTNFTRILTALYDKYKFFHSLEFFRVFVAYLFFLYFRYYQYINYWKPVFIYTIVTRIL